MSIKRKKPSIFLDYFVTSILSRHELKIISIEIRNERIPLSYSFSLQPSPLYDPSTDKHIADYVGIYSALPWDLLQLIFSTKVL